MSLKEEVGEEKIGKAGGWRDSLSCISYNHSSVGLPGEHLSHQLTRETEADSPASQKEVRLKITPALSPKSLLGAPGNKREVCCHYF